MITTNTNQPIHHVDFSVQVKDACAKAIEFLRGMKKGKGRDIAAYAYIAGIEAGWQQCATDEGWDRRNPYSGLRFIVSLRGYSEIERTAKGS